MQLATLQRLDIPGLRDVEIKDSTVGKIVQLMFDCIENAKLAVIFFSKLSCNPSTDERGIFIMLNFDSLLKA